MNIVKIIPALALCVLCGCTDRVVFVTATQLGVNADSHTQTVSVGYDRTEGVVGPAYIDKGTVPPVLATLSSDLNTVDPKVSQVYATGTAAAKIGSHKPDPADAKPDCDPSTDTSGARRVFFFGTTTNVGLRVAVTPNGLPDNMNFGYKREEVSLIPLHKSDGQDDKFPSVLATVSVDGHVGSFTTTDLNLRQVFATGTAANNLAGQKDIQDAINKTAAKIAGAAAEGIPDKGAGGGGGK